MTANSLPQLPNNLAVLRGFVARPPVARQLPAGGRVLQFDLATEGSNHLSSPVAIHDETVIVEEGDHIIVVGQVVRRFFRTGGATASRTEVGAAAIIKATKRPSTERAVWRASAKLVN
ncbi:MAG TPA: hypothetical protein VMM60_04895 [Ilumatobacter sp.]|nr:hypothetical protein [Ilumatobacter sp.]